SPKVVLLGFPSDEGVKRNGGREGAAEAPDEIRKELYKMTPDAEETEPFNNLLEHTNGIGDVNVSGALASDQELLGKIVAGYLEQDVIPVILGGGHETAFGHFLGYAEAGLTTSIFNLDAHTDVRPLKNGQAHSGSPFRQALEHESNCAETYLAAGLQPHAVAKSHINYIEEKSGSVLFRDETNITSISGLFHQHESKRLMVTFDMDAVDQSQAPGVSAPCANGLPSDLWLTAAYLAGRNGQVTSFDICEVNPTYDRDGQTAKLAALTIWNFLLGVSQR
ncbi:MAG TPA: formimidoylglutamase, partial [Fodinibius sp.]|nr:formimidoylglutamase [Fodinibius sp.]